MSTEIFESFHKVRTFECDLYGHVNNATYLNYLEFARMEILENKGLNLDILKEMGFMLVVRRVDILYKFPAAPGDPLMIRSNLKEYRRSSGTFHQEIIRTSDQKPIAEADVTWVSINLGGKPVPFPDAIREAFNLSP